MTQRNERVKLVIEKDKNSKNFAFEIEMHKKYGREYGVDEFRQSGQNWRKSSESINK